MSTKRITSAVEALENGFIEIDDLIAAYEKHYGPEFFTEARAWVASLVAGDSEKIEESTSVPPR
jgi:hypothetical protein